MLLECLLRIKRWNPTERYQLLQQRGAKRIRGFEKVTSLSAITRKPHPPTYHREIDYKADGKHKIRF